MLHNLFHLVLTLLPDDKNINAGRFEFNVNNVLLVLVREIILSPVAFTTWNITGDISNS